MSRNACKVTKAQARKLGEVMSQWHSSMSDPIYAVSSHLYVDQEPNMRQVEFAIQDISRTIPRAVAGAAGWGPREVAELRTIHSGLIKVQNCLNAGATFRGR